MSCEQGSQQQFKAGYSVVVKVNGVAVQGLELTRRFDSRNNEGMTLSGHMLLHLTKNDVVTVELVPVESTSKRYIIDAGDARLNMKLEPWF
jgi:hypothetical protein